MHLLLFSLFLLLPHAVSLTIDGSVLAREDGIGMHDPARADKLHFLGRFCFSNTGSGMGTVTMTANVARGGGGTNVVLVDDTRWADLWRQREIIGCTQALGAMSGQGAFLWTTDLPEGKSARVLSVEDNVRPHYWYAAAMNCKGPMDFTYSIRFVQPDGTLLSFDDVGVMTAYEMLLVLLLVLLFLHGFAHNWNLPYMYGVTVLTTIVLLSLSLACVLKILHIFLMSQDGRGSPFLSAVGDLCHASAQLFLCSIFLLVSNGWGALSPVLRREHRRHILLLLLLFVVFHVYFLLNDWFFLDHASATYAYESLPGFLVVALQVASLAFFGFRLRETMNTLEGGEKKRFLLLFGCLACVWFILVPVAVLIATLLDPYVRAKSVAIMRLVIDGSTVTVLVWLVMPSRLDKYFQQASLPSWSDVAESAPYEDL